MNNNYEENWIVWINLQSLYAATPLDLRMELLFDVYKTQHWVGECCSEQYLGSSLSTSSSWWNSHESIWGKSTNDDVM
jgi:hypothetical protein